MALNVFWLTERRMTNDRPSMAEREEDGVSEILAGRLLLRSMTGGLA
jgi:hypothetical protein